jgi:uncharacterized membrane protein
MFLVHGHEHADADQPTVGQHMAEQVAGGVGSWWFLGLQAFFLILWLIYNTLVFTHHFDSYPYILLNLLLSFQAAFTGPVLLIAANVGAMRDHRQYDRIEQLGRQTEQLADRLLDVESRLDQHVAKSLELHTKELQELSALVRTMHASIMDGSPAVKALAAVTAGPETDESLGNITPAERSDMASVSPTTDVAAAITAKPATRRAGTASSRRR